jgi:hypothetical protein
MDSFSAVIDAFGGPPGFADAIGVPDSHARTMKARDSIPPAHWQRTAAAAIIKKVPGVSLDLLARLAATRQAAPQKAGTA